MNDCCSKASHRAAGSRGDDYAWGESFLSRIDPRVKIASVAALLAINLYAGSVLVSSVVAASMAVLMLAGRVPYRRQLLAIAFPATFAIFIIISQTIFEGRAVFAGIGPLDLHSDGFLHGLFLSLRVVAGGLVIVVLGVSTPLNRLCLALRWYRAPSTFVEVLQLTYRYLFDIHGEFSRMREAQRSRLGWSQARNGLASSRMLGGSLFLRVYERGLRSSEAMRCRGAGLVAAGTLSKPGRLDLAAGSIVVALVAVLSIYALSGGRP